MRALDFVEASGSGRTQVQYICTRILQTTLPSWYFDPFVSLSYHPQVRLVIHFPQDLFPSRFILCLSTGIFSPTQQALSPESFTLVPKVVVLMLLLALTFDFMILAGKAKRRTWRFIK